MGRRGPAHHKPRKQKRGVQVAVRAPIRMVERDAALVQRVGEESEPPTLLASPPGTPTFPADPDPTAVTWLWRVEFLHIKHSVRAIQRLIVRCPESTLWSAGQAMARREGTRYFEQRIAKQQEGLNEYAFITAACEGRLP
jgi:hypothetical protein